MLGTRLRETRILTYFTPCHDLLIVHGLSVFSRVFKGVYAVFSHIFKDTLKAFDDQKQLPKVFYKKRFS